MPDLTPKGGDSEPSRSKAEDSSAGSSPLRTTPRLRPRGVRWWHLLFGGGVALLTAFMAPREKSLEFANLAEGSVSPSKVIAPFDFEILKSPDDLTRERNEASDAVLPVFVADDSLPQGYIDELHAFAVEADHLIGNLSSVHFAALDDRAVHLAHEDSLELQDLTGAVFHRFGFRLAPETWRFLLSLHRQNAVRPGAFFGFFDKSLTEILRRIYAQGVINLPRGGIDRMSATVCLERGGSETQCVASQLFTTQDAAAQLSQQLSENLKSWKLPGALSAGYDLMQPFLVPNCSYDSAETDRRRQIAVARVPIAKGLVKKDELIIDRHIRVSREHLDKLNSLVIKEAEIGAQRGSWAAILPPIGYLLLTGLIIYLLGSFIATAHPAVWKDWKLMLCVALVPMLLIIFQRFVIVLNDLPDWLFPAAVGTMLLAILVNRQVAAAGLSLVALPAALIGGNNFALAFAALIIGGTAIMAIKRVQNRGDVMRSGLYLLAVSIPLVIGFHIANFGSANTLTSDLLYAGTNAVLSPILVLGLVYLFESVLGLTTEVALLELVDLNRPLLRELALKSPGTYHHSILVGNLAEAAARAVGANAILTRAGAYYHDIGKMAHKEYFIENQEMGSPNVHDRLSPEKSARLVIDHVKAGLELAEEHGLPAQIRAFISEHHGCTRASYFYEKAVREYGNGVSDRPYRYPGPDPRTKETGILMLADLVEAATRSEETHTPEALRETVERLIKKRLSDGDLDQTPLTMRELNIIRDAFVQALSGIYHQRIPYPGAANGALNEALSAAV